VYERIVALDPFDGEARAALAGWPCSGTTSSSRRVSSVPVIALKPIDPAVAHTDLAETYLKAGKRDECEAPDAGRARDLRRHTNARRICC